MTNSFAGAMPKTLILIIVILVFAAETRATVLYVRYNVNEIIIGTDSKRTVETGQTVCVCKILQVGNTVIASAGLAEYGAFDPRAFAREAINSSQSLVEARAKFEELISQPLLEVLQKLKARHSERYEVFKTGAAINMVFARYTDKAELV